MSLPSKLKGLLRQRSSLGILAGLVLLLSALALRGVGSGLETYHASLAHGMMIIGGLALTLISVLYPFILNSSSTEPNGPES